MRNGYERASREIVPAVRYALIKRLKAKYNMREEDISKYLGITQAAISKYLGEKRSAKIKAISEKIDANIIEECAESIRGGGEELVDTCICSVCTSLNSFGCRFSRVNVNGTANV